MVQVGHKVDFGTECEFAAAAPMSAVEERRILLKPQANEKLEPNNTGASHALHLLKSRGSVLRDL